MQRLIQRAFFYLEFPSSLSSSFELKADLLPKEIQDLMIRRLKLVLEKNIPAKCVINEIKKKAEQSVKKEQSEPQPGFIQIYQTIADNLIILGWIRVLLSLYENYYLQVFICFFGYEHMKKNEQTQKNIHKGNIFDIFIAGTKSEVLVPLFDEDEITDRELHFWKVKVCYQACFPFSWNFHMWCLDKLQNIARKFNNDIANVEPIGINDKVLKTDAILKSNFSGDDGNVFLLLNRCSFKNCGFYVKDVIRGKFHAYFSMEDSDQIAEILKGIVLYIVQIIIGKDIPVNISSIETILYYFENIITKYVQLVFLFKDTAVVISDIKEILSSYELVMPLEQLIKITSIMCEYFLTHKPSKSELEDFTLKMTIARHSTITILKFLRQQQYTEVQVYQDFLSVCRQLHMETLIIKHFVKGVVSSTTNDNDNDFEVKEEFLKDSNVIPKIIESAAKYIIPPLSNKAHNCLYFIRDLLRAVESIEHMEESDNQKTFQCAIQTLFDEPQKFVELSLWRYLLKSQYLEVLVRNQWLHILKSPEAFIDVVRVYEKLFVDTDFKRNILEQDSYDANQKIAVVAKLKVRLTKRMYLFFENAIMTEEMLKKDKMKSIFYNICKDLLYFRNNRDKFGDSWNEYLHHLHQWFLRECYMLKGVNWTKQFLTQLLIRQQFPIFVNQELSNVFSELQWQCSKDQFAQPFNAAFRKRYNYFEEKLTAGDYNCYKEDKQDIPPLLIAALSISISVSQYETLPKIFTFLQNLNFISSRVEQSFVNKVLSTNSQTTMFHSSNFKDMTDETITRLCFHWLGTLQITKICLFVYFCEKWEFTMFELIITDNPFKVLLTDSNKFERERKPGEKPKKKAQDTEFVIRYCSNGHPFFVKKYQSYRKEIKCPDPWCNALTNKTNTTSDKKIVIEYVNKKNYFLFVSNENKENTTMSPLICTLLQLLYRLTLLLRDIDKSKESIFYLWKKAKGKFLLLSKMTEMNEEQLCMALHEWLCEFPQWFNKTYPNELNKVDLQSINQFESKIEEQYSQFFKHYKASHFSQKIQSISNMLDCETKEEHTSSDRFMSQIKPELASAYPLLFNMLKSIDDLECVKCLPAIGQWMKHCHMQFSGKLTQYQHKEKTVSSVIDNCNNTKLKKHWNQFIKGWNRLNGRELNIGSDTVIIPTLSQDPGCVSLNHCTSRKDIPGRYTVAMIEILQDSNNNFLQKNGK
ncbi:hypothetical protein RFI_38339 [Reticulomyxa filosa]|uniref:Uncharacterized protein n=1 Tax=Reticulomyxa filosa TaxID=46433 RepID=X6LC73_RETFI|nr:hypothetical protein RFI_38339 [Reticulomyxa filosa]|eukprot:ETN99143.1 hypothetical protein RFI_38339 [Reticulomyxa filosa]